jgi:hypothetical protein
LLCGTRPPRRKLARPTGLSITRHTSAHAANSARTPAQAVPSGPPAGPTPVWGYDAAVDCVLRMQCVVFADSDGGGVVDIGSAQAPAGDAELAGQLRARKINGGFHGPFGVL